MACREEALLDETMRMYIKLQEAGVKTDITIDEGLYHCYMLDPMLESYVAFDKIAAFVKKF